MSDIEIEVDNFDESDYIDGADVDEEELNSESTDDISDEFISDTGDIVVMSNNEADEDAFEIEYIDIEKIIVVKPIRKPKSVSGLTRSIKSTGMISPITVGYTATKGIYVLLDGMRRLIACANAGKKRVPCVVNKNISTNEIPIIAAMYNQKQAYTMQEIVDYIEYIEKEKGIMSASMIEFLLQLNSGDYVKLKDVLEDNDDEIVGRLFSGVFTIDQAFRKLEQKRKKQSVEEQENSRAEAVYENEEKSGIINVAGAGEVADGEAVNIDISADSIDDGLYDKSLTSMVEEGNKMPAFQPHKQNVGQREYIDPSVRKAVMARDNFTCACCRKGGQSYIDILDFHHILPVFLGGTDSVDNGIMLCVACHRLVHLYSTGDLTIPKEKTSDEFEEMTPEERGVYEDEQMRFKRIVKLGTVIREGIEKKGMSREEYKKEHPNTGIGRRKPGVNAEQDRA